MTRMAVCKACGYEDYTHNMARVDSPSRGYFFVCCDCRDREESYHVRNNYVKGIPAKHGLTFGFEFETSTRNDESNLLYEYGFIPTSDGSIYGTEWKSPIYQNLSGIKKMFRTFDEILHIGEDCGTHLNIGTFDEYEIIYIRRFYHSLFVPFSDYLYDNPYECQRVIGRFFNSYAQKITFSEDATERYNFVNVANSNRIEFRLCKFVNSRQYMDCVKLHKDIVLCIRKNFIDHFNDNVENKTKHRKHKAQVTAKKIVKIFKKYANK